MRHSSDHIENKEVKSLPQNPDPFFDLKREAFAPPPAEAVQKKKNAKIRRDQKDQNDQKNADVKHKDDSKNSEPEFDFKTIYNNEDPVYIYNNRDVVVIENKTDPSKKTTTTKKFDEDKKNVNDPEVIAKINQNKKYREQFFRLADAFIAWGEENGFPMTFRSLRIVNSFDEIPQSIPKDQLVAWRTNNVWNQDQVELRIYWNENNINRNQALFPYEIEELWPVLEEVWEEIRANPSQQPKNNLITGVKAKKIIELILVKYQCPCSNHVDGLLKLKLGLALNGSFFGFWSESLLNIFFAEAKKSLEKTYLGLMNPSIHLNTRQKEFESLCNIATTACTKGFLNRINNVNNRISYDLSLDNLLFLLRLSIADGFAARFKFKHKVPEAYNAHVNQWTYNYAAHQGWGFQYVEDHYANFYTPSSEEITELNHDFINGYQPDKIIDNLTTTFLEQFHKIFESVYEIGLTNAHLRHLLPKHFPVIESKDGKVEDKHDRIVEVISSYAAITYDKKGKFLKQVNQIILKKLGFNRKLFEKIVLEHQDPTQLTQPDDQLDDQDEKSLTTHDSFQIRRDYPDRIRLFLLVSLYQSGSTTLVVRDTNLQIPLNIEPNKPNTYDLSESKSTIALTYHTEEVCSPINVNIFDSLQFKIKLLEFWITKKKFPLTHYLSEIALTSYDLQTLQIPLNLPNQNLNFNFAPQKIYLLQDNPDSWQPYTNCLVFFESKFNLRLRQKIPTLYYIQTTQDGQIERTEIAIQDYPGLYRFLLLKIVRTICLASIFEKPLTLSIPEAQTLITDDTGHRPSNTRKIFKDSVWFSIDLDNIKIFYFKTKDRPISIWTEDQEGNFTLIKDLGHLFESESIRKLWMDSFFLSIPIYSQSDYQNGLKIILRTILNHQYLFNDFIRSIDQLKNTASLAEIILFALLDLSNTADNSDLADLYKDRILQLINLPFDINHVFNSDNCILYKGPGAFYNCILSENPFTIIHSLVKNQRLSVVELILLHRQDTNLAPYGDTNYTAAELFLALKNQRIFDLTLIHLTQHATRYPLDFLLRTNTYIGIARFPWYSSLYRQFFLNLIKDTRLIITSPNVIRDDPNKLNFYTLTTWLESLTEHLTDEFANIKIEDEHLKIIKLLCEFGAAIEPGINGWLNKFFVAQNLEILKIIQEGRLYFLSKISDKKTGEIIDQQFLDCLFSYIQQEIRNETIKTKKVKYICELLDVFHEFFALPYYQVHLNNLLDACTQHIAVSNLPINALQFQNLNGSQEQFFQCLGNHALIAFKAYQYGARPNAAFRLILFFGDCRNNFSHETKNSLENKENNSDNISELSSFKILSACKNNPNLLKQLSIDIETILNSDPSDGSMMGELLKPYPDLINLILIELLRSYPTSKLLPVLFALNPNLDAVFDFVFEAVPNFDLCKIRLELVIKHFPINSENKLITSDEKASGEKKNEFNLPSVEQIINNVLTNEGFDHFFENKDVKEIKNIYRRLATLTHPDSRTFNIHHASLSNVLFIMLKDSCDKALNKASKTNQEQKKIPLIQFNNFFTKPIARSISQKLLDNKPLRQGLIRYFYKLTQDNRLLTCLPVFYAYKKTLVIELFYEALLLKFNFPLNLLSPDHAIADSLNFLRGICIRAIPHINEIEKECALLATLKYIMVLRGYPENHLKDALSLILQSLLINKKFKLAEEVIYGHRTDLENSFQFNTDSLTACMKGDTVLFLEACSHEYKHALEIKTIPSGAHSLNPITHLSNFDFSMLLQFTLNQISQNKVCYDFRKIFWGFLLMHPESLLEEKTHRNYLNTLAKIQKSYAEIKASIEEKKSTLHLSRLGEFEIHNSHEMGVIDYLPRFLFAVEVSQYLNRLPNVSNSVFPGVDLIKTTGKKLIQYALGDTSKKFGVSCHGVIGNSDLKEIIAVYRAARFEIALDLWDLPTPNQSDSKSSPNTNSDSRSCILS